MGHWAKIIMADKLRIKPLAKSKGLSESKLRAFDIGNMSLTKSLSKREQEEMKRKKDQEATAEVYAEFVASFEDAGKMNKSWVKGGIAGREDKKELGGGSRLYKPTSKLTPFAKEIKKEEPKLEERPQKPN